jgi:hypothetical protein
MYIQRLAESLVQKSFFFFEVLVLKLMHTCTYKDAFSVQSPT